MKKHLLFFILLTSIASATNITLSNNITITGDVISIDKDYLYLVKDGALFIIEKKIITRVDQETAKTNINRMAKQHFHRINYNSYKEMIEIDNRNFYDDKLYKTILKYFPENNPEKPTYKKPPDPAINKHNSLTIKPARLLLKWVDGTYCYRFTKLGLEWRFSASYLSKFQSGDSSLYTSIEDLNSITTSLRYYPGKTCSGIFTGIGYSTATFITNDLSYYFGFLKSDDQAKFNLKGILFEAGTTITGEGTFTMSGWLALLAANAKYECLNRDKSSQRIIVRPSLNISIGFLF